MTSELGNMFFAIGGDIGPLTSSLNVARGILGNFGGAMSNLIAVGADLGLGLAKGAGEGVWSLLQMGSALEEQNSMFDTVFGKQAGATREWAGSFASAAGRSKQELEGMAASIQSMLVPMGQSETSAAKMSQKLTMLATDLGSFKNLPTAEVLDKIKAGITGEFDSLKSLGIVLNQSILDEKLKAEGLAKSSATATSAQKSLAVYKLLLEKSSQAQGDAVKTSDSFENQMRGLQGALTDLGGELGTVLVPAGKAVVGVIMELVDWFIENKNVAMGWGKTLSDAVIYVSEIGKQLIFMFTNWDLAMQVAGIKIMEGLTNIGIFMNNLFTNGISLAVWFAENWSEALMTAVDFVLTALINVGENMRSLWDNLLGMIEGKEFNPQFKGLTEGFKSAISKLPEIKPFIATTEFDSQLEDVGREYNRRWDAIQNKKMEKVDAPDYSDALTGVDAGKEKGKETEKKGGKVSLQSAFDNLQKAALGDKDKLAKQQAKATDSILEENKKQTAALQTIAGKKEPASALKP